MKRSGVFLIMFVFCSCVLFAQADPQALQHYNNGLNFYNDNKFDLAIDEYTRAIEIYPKFAEAYLERGNCYDNKDDAKTAYEDYMRAGYYDEKYLLFARGYEYASERIGRYDEAIVLLTQCIDQKINTFIAYIMRGNSYVSLDDFTNGIKDYTEAIMISPNIFQPYLNRGATHMILGNFDQSISDFLMSAELNPDFYWAYYFLCILYELTGDFDRANKMMDILENLDIDIESLFD